MDALRLIVLLLLCGSGCGGGEGSSSSPRPAEQVLIENNVGLAYYGIQHPAWPCEESLAAMANQAVPKISFVWNAFGTETACLEAFLSDPRPKVLEVHLFDEVCSRKGTCQPYDFGGHLSRGQFAAAVRGGDGVFFAALKKYAAPVAAFLRGREGLTCLISPGLESNLPAELGARVIEFVRPLFPQCEMVWNGGGRIAGTIYESHVMRNTWPPCILSNDDGEWPTDDELHLWREAGRECRYFFAWHPTFNGWQPGIWEGDRRRRTGWPTSSTLERFRLLVESY